MLESQFLILVISLLLARSPRKFKDKGENGLMGVSIVPLPSEMSGAFPWENCEFARPEK